MIKIVINDNKYLSIETDDYDLLSSIDREFSYKPAGVEFTPAYKAGWSGIIKLLVQKDSKFWLPLGLLDRLQAFLSGLGYKAVLLDQRPDLVLEPQIDLGGILAQLNTIPRDYQEMVVETAFRARKGIVRAATGSGKSLMIALLTAKINKSTIVYVIGLDLLGQFHKTLSELFNEPIGYIGNGICDPKRINVASIWTIGRSLGLKKNIIDDDSTEKEILKAENNAAIIELLKTTKTHVFDEAHVIGCETIKQIYKVIDPERIYGFSGTPFREDNSEKFAEGVLGPQIVNVSASSLIEKGYLTKPYIKFVPVPKIHGAAKDYPSVYRDCIVENEYRNQLIVSNTKMLLDKGFRTLVLYKQIKHGQILQDLFAENNIDIEMLNGNDTTARRDEVKEKIATGKIQAILASTIFDVGVDIPSLSGLVLAGGGNSSIRCLQRIGRSIRKYPGKEKVAVIDFYDDAKFLKQHSKKRYKIYTSEDGFEVIKWPEN
jgi:superfamily II DNA or RNA helicase